ncbi:MAG: enoyl-CoA hydratase/isomerase family protein [Caldilineaceae bacterium]
MQHVVRYGMNNGVAHITLSAPQTGNLLNPPALAQLQDALQLAAADPTCRAIVIGAEGAVFCNGLDLEAAFGAGRAPEIAFFQALADCLLLIATCPQPVLAKVDGLATGGGVGLAAACDFVLATSNAHFILSEVVIGMIPALITPYLLQRIAPAQVRYLALSSRRINAGEAQRLGLVDEVVEADLESAVESQLQRIFRSSPVAIAEYKRYLAACNQDALARQSSVAVHKLTDWLRRPEVVAGIQTFADGFSPPWWQKYSTNNKGGN